MTAGSKNVDTDFAGPRAVIARHAFHHASCGGRRSAEATRARRHQSCTHEHGAGRQDLSRILQAPGEAFGTLDGFLDLVRSEQSDGASAEGGAGAVLARGDHRDCEALVAAEAAALRRI